jgi:hypothetical protein
MERGSFSEMAEGQNQRPKILLIISLFGIIRILRYEFVPSKQIKYSKFKLWKYVAQNLSQNTFFAS